MDREVQKMFEEKNKEIIKNNLQLDIERNIASLDDTLINIFNNNFDVAIKNIISMYEDSRYQESSSTVIKLMNKLKMDTYGILNKLITDKKDKLINKILDIDFKEKDMEEYYNLVFSTTDEIKTVFSSDDIFKLKDKCIKDFDNYSEKVLNDDAIYITKSRVNDYITYRLFGKIEERVNMEFTLRDNSLRNKGRESYEKFQDLSRKTANI